jgi:hypothetical protein
LLLISSLSEYTNMRALHLLTIVYLLSGCASAGNRESVWVEKKIREFESAPVANPPRAIYASTYQGNEVVYISAACCDIPDALYSRDGDLICAPSGGFTGRGDGRCPDFFEGGKKQPAMRLIWQDERKGN